MGWFKQLWIVELRGAVVGRLEVFCELGSAVPLRVRWCYRLAEASQALHRVASDLSPGLEGVIEILRLPVSACVEGIRLLRHLDVLDQCWQRAGLRLHSILSLS